MSTVKVGSGNDIAIMCRLGRGGSNPPWPNVRQHGASAVTHLHAARVQNGFKQTAPGMLPGAALFPSGRQAVRPSLRYGWTARTAHRPRSANARPRIALLAGQHTGRRHVEAGGDVLSQQAQLGKPAKATVIGA